MRSVSVLLWSHIQSVETSTQTGLTVEMLAYTNTPEPTTANRFNTDTDTPLVCESVCWDMLMCLCVFGGFEAGKRDYFETFLRET